MEKWLLTPLLFALYVTADKLACSFPICPPKMPKTIAWPSESFIHTAPDTSASIANFLIREKGDIYNGIDKVADVILGNVEDVLKGFRENEITLDKDSFSLRFVREVYPPTLIGREPTRLVRPAIVDGLALAFGYYPHNNYLFLGPSADLPFQANKVLPVRPFVDVSLFLILHGHKVTIFLPEYYRTPCVKLENGQSVWKVDDVYSFRVLYELGIIDFVDPEISPIIIDFPAKIREKVKEVGGCFFSDQIIVKKYSDLVKKPQLRKPKEAGDLISVEEREKLYNDSSARLLTVKFCGPRKELVLVTVFSIYIGSKNYHHSQRKDQYEFIFESVVLFYTENAGEPRDVVKLQEQLTLKNQILAVIALSELEKLTIFQLRRVQCFLRFAKESKICENEIKDFIKKHRWRGI